MARTRPEKSSKEVSSLVPARLDRLPWTKFHWSVVVGLGVAWILDGLEIQIVASAGFAKDLHMSAVQVGLASSVYLVGQVVVALIFGTNAERQSLEDVAEPLSKVEATNTNE